MVRRAADYLLSRQTERGVHGNAFDTWETFIGSFTYSNAAIYAAFLVAHQQLGDSKYLQGRTKHQSWRCLEEFRARKSMVTST